MTSPTEQTAPRPLARSWQNWLLLGALVICWGSTFALIKISVASFTPEWVVTFRLGLAVLMMLPLIYFTGRRLPARRHWPGITWLAVTGYVVPSALIAWGTIYIASALAGILMALVPLMTTLLAHFLLPDEKMGIVKLVGIIVGLAGAVFMIGPENLLTIQSQETVIWAQLAVVAAGAFYAVHGVIARRLPPIDTTSRATAVCIAGAVISLPIALWYSPGNPIHAPASAWLAVTGLALIPTAIAAIVLYRLLERSGASFVAYSNYLIPAYAIALGALALGEHLPLYAFVGFALIILGVAISELGSRRR